MNNQLFGKEARQKIKQGVDKVCNVVGVTYGPLGRNFGAFRPLDEAPLISKDGVSAAKEVSSLDEVESVGINAIKSAADKTVKEVGDSTTLTCILAQEIYSLGMDQVNNGSNPIELKKGIEHAVEEVCKYIDDVSTPIESINDIRNVARVATNSDDELSNLIVQAYEKVGKEGNILVGNSNSPLSYVTITEGIIFNKGYLVRYFINNPNKGTWEAENPIIAIADKEITTLKGGLQELMQIAVNENRPLLIIAQTTKDEALATLALNAHAGRINACVVDAPHSFDIRTAYLHDFAALTGATVVSDVTGVKFDDMVNGVLANTGTAKKVIVGETKTIIIGGDSNEAEILERKSEIENKLNGDCTEFNARHYRERLAMLQGIVAQIFVGSNSDVEQKEKEDRLDDALRSVRSSTEEGIIDGCGYTLNDASSIELLDKDIDYTVGFEIVKQAIQRPLERILENGYLDVDKIKDEMQTKGRYLPKLERYGDIREHGVVDSAKAIKTALRNAASVAGTLLTTEVVIY